MATTLGENSRPQRGAAAGWEMRAMTFQEWLRTEPGRMVAYEKLPRMLEIVWDASANNSELRSAELEAQLAGAAAAIVTLTKERDAARRELQRIKQTLAVGRNVGEDKEQAHQDAEEIADIALNGGDDKPLDEWEQTHAFRGILGDWRRR